MLLEDDTINTLTWDGFISEFHRMPCLWVLLKLIFFAETRFFFVRTKVMELWFLHVWYCVIFFFLIFLFLLFLLFLFFLHLFIFSLFFSFLALPFWFILHLYNLIKFLHLFPQLFLVEGLRIVAVNSLCFTQILFKKSWEEVNKRREDQSRWCQTKYVVTNILVLVAEIQDFP